jgi:hypothetical protein
VVGQVEIEMAKVVFHQGNSVVISGKARANTVQMTTARAECEMDKDLEEMGNAMTDRALKGRLAKVIHLVIFAEGDEDLARRVIMAQVLQAKVSHRDLGLRRMMSRLVVQWEKRAVHLDRQNSITIILRKVRRAEDLAMVRNRSNNLRAPVQRQNRNQVLQQAEQTHRPNRRNKLLLTSCDPIFARIFLTDEFGCQFSRPI